MKFLATQIALMIDGKIEGDANAFVTSFGKIEEAKMGQLAFLSNSKYEDYIYTTNASIIIVNETLEIKQPLKSTLIRVKDAYSAFAILLDKYQQLENQQLIGVQQPSYIEKTVTLGSNVFVGAFSYIGANTIVLDGAKIFPQVYLGNNVTIGENSIIYPGVIIYNDCIIGKNVIIHSGTIIGSDGFGFAPLADGTYKKIPQIGNVIIEDDVEIGANTAIDRATMGSTIIKAGAKLDNLLQIAHNVEIGNNTVIAAQAGISGSTKIGNNVMIGGQAGLAGHIQIGSGAKINGQSGVGKSLKSGKTVTGTPAYDFTAMMRTHAASRKLPDLEKRIAALENLISSYTEIKK